MCKLEGCEADPGSRRKLYCGSQDDWGTCAYYRKVEVAKLHKQNKKEGKNRKIYKKICVHCNKELITKIHNQASHGTQEDRKSCSYLFFIKWQREYMKAYRKKD